MKLLSCTPTPPWGPRAVVLVSATATLPGATGQWILQCIAISPWGDGHWKAYNALPHCLEAVGSATRAIQCLTAWGPWAIQLLQCTTTPPGRGGKWNSCNMRAHQLV